MRQIKGLVTFATSLGLLTIIFTAIWGVFITDNLYNCTDAVGFDYLQPGNWVHDNVAFVNQVRAGRSMSEPDTIKEGWSVPALWALWLLFFGSSVVASAFLARGLSAARRSAEPTSSPNGGPAMRVCNSGVAQAERSARR